MATVQLERDEFEIKDLVHPYRRAFFPRQTKPYYINRVVMHGEVLRYTIFVSPPRMEHAEPQFRGESDTEILDDPIRVEKNYDVMIEFYGPMSVECSLICSPGKKED